MNLENINVKKSIFGSLNTKTKILYIVNHKVANTTIVSILKECGYTDRTTHELNISDLNFIFTFVRNPYSRLVSRYIHMKNFFIDSRHRHKSLSVGQAAQTSIKKYFEYHNIEFTEDNFNFPRFVKFAQKKVDPHWESQIDKFESQVISLDNIDFIGKLENLQQDFNTVCDKIKIPQQQLPHLNKTNHKHYTEYYDDETKQIVAEKYAKDIEYFGYEFGG